MFETEGDTLANTFASDYGDYSNGFRKAFHHETISYVRRKDREYVNLKHPRLAASGSSTGQKSVRRQFFLDKLPDSFTRKGFIDISASLGIPLKTAEGHISQWCKDGLIERIEQGKYLKC